MRKYYFLLPLVLLAAFFAYHQTQGGEAESVTITVDGKALYHFSDSDLKKERDIEIQTEGGYNVVHIGKEIYMKSADCKDRLCVKQGRLTREGRPIVCLPHKLVVEGR